ncbi:hypothetical protein [Azospirillum argentinense]
MITVTTADKWLKPGGRLAFVITETVFQTPSSQGFRRFRISRNGTERLIPLSVDDLKDLKPFADATNKTAVALFEKREDGEVRYPVAYTVWRGKPKLDPDGSPKWGRNGRMQRAKTIDPGLPLPEVLRRVERVAMEATPVLGKDDGAPWAVMHPGRFPEVAEIFGSSSWVNGRKGITTDLNGVYFVTVTAWNAATRQARVRTRPDEGKTNIGVAKDFWIDADLLYPLAKGAGDFDACHFRPDQEVFAVVPNKGIDSASLAAARAIVKGPSRRHKDVLRHLRDAVAQPGDVQAAPDEQPVLFDLQRRRLHVRSVQGDLAGDNQRLSCRRRRIGDRPRGRPAPVRARPQDLLRGLRHQGGGLFPVRPDEQRRRP